jgi:hypothetical protein
MHSSRLFWVAARRELLLCAIVVNCTLARAQTSVPDAANQAALAESVHELQSEIKELRSAVAELRSEAAQYHAETLALRQELQVARGQTSNNTAEKSSNPSWQTPAAGYSETSAQAASGVEQNTPQTPPTLEEQIQLLNGKVDDQYQTKVESASKYRVRLSGIVLFNLFSNRGNVDNADFPHLVVPQTDYHLNGSFGGTLRQSLLGLEVFGPKLAGARTSGDVQFDFAGGFNSQAPNGVTSGLVRLRTATLHLDWARASVVAGQDALFFAPLSPTSLASFAEPALAYSGNLWDWIPQVRVERRFQFSGDSMLTLQAGILDPITEQRPASSFYRVAQAGEASAQPGIGSHLGWSRLAFGQPLTLGVGGYYSRQNWGLGRTVDSWVGISDWNLPLGRLVSVSGEFYRGRAIGGLGGGIGYSVLMDAANPTGPLQPLDDIGGWSQLKFKPLAKLEFNAAVGQDSVFGSDLRAFPAVIPYFNQLERNRGGFVNFIYRPRSDLLFSMEYRRLETSALAESNNSANHVNLSMGILF